MAESDNLKDFLKIEDDDEHFTVYNILFEPEDIPYDRNEDPLLFLSPVVYTTKLDDMNTVKQDLTKLTAQEILKKLHSESKPIIRANSNQSSSNSNNVQSYIKLASVISDINFKTTSQLPADVDILPISNEGIKQENVENTWNSENVDFEADANVGDTNFEINPQIAIPDECINSNVHIEADKKESTIHSNFENVKYNASVASDVNFIMKSQILINTSITSSSSAYLDAQKEYKPCYVVLEDIKKLIKANQTAKLDSLDRVINKVKQEFDSCDLDIKEEVDVSTETQITRNTNEISVSAPTNMIDPSHEESQKQTPDSGENLAEKLVTKDKSNEIASSGRPKRKRKARIFYETSSEDLDIDVDVTTETPISRKQHKNEKSVLNASKLVSTNVTNSSHKESQESQKEIPDSEGNPAEKLEINDKSTEITSSGLSKRKRKARIFYDTSSDDEYVPDANINKKSKTSQPAVNNAPKSVSPAPKIGPVPEKVSSSNIVSKKPSNIQSVIVITNDSAQSSFHEKYALIVLTDKKKKTFIYRVNNSKLVTDYYVTKNCDEYKLASMYPREEKIIEQYCCWYKREQIIAKICLRKNYPFTILKFLKQPHTCHPEECRCCCQIINIDSSENKQSEKRALINKSHTVAEQWISELLNKTKPTNAGLVDKALTYIPKTIEKKPVEKQSEKYLETYLLCLRSIANIYESIEYELYEIGQNNTVLKSLLIHNEEEVAKLRRSYQSLSMPIRDANLCCWFKREKLMKELKMLKTSPAALKRIQKAHSCNRQKCSCCCKPLTVILKAVGTLPSNFRQTTAYEKSRRPLTIQFSAKSKNAKLRPKYQSGKTKKSTDASTAAVILSGCATKDDNPELSLSILSKFKNLKLGVNSDGTLEVVLNGPAKDLSVPELKVLSDILSLSTKQIDELGLSAEEFCNRINSKTEDVVRITVPESPLISTEEIASSPLQGQCDDNAFAEVEDEYTNEDDLSLTNFINKPKLTGSTVRNSPDTRSEPARKTAAPSPKIYATKTNCHSMTNMFSSLSALMEQKNKNYVDSFKSYFNNSNPTNFVVPDNNKFKPVPKSVDAIVRASIESSPMPIIKETFTLAIVPADGSPIAVPGPSGVTLQQRVNMTTSLQESKSGDNSSLSRDFTQTRTTTKSTKTDSYKMENIINVEVEKKIRVKNPSELNSLIQPISHNSQSVAWPTPIVIKREPQSNIPQIVKSVKSTALTISPNQTPNLKIVGSTPVAVKNVFQINSNSIQVSAGTATKTNSVRYLTLSPLRGHISGDTCNKTMLAKFLTAPQAKPNVTSGTCSVPPLVPIRLSSAHVPKETSDRSQDIENTITYSVIRHKK